MSVIRVLMVCALAFGARTAFAADPPPVDTKPATDKTATTETSDAAKPESTNADAAKPMRTGVPTKMPQPYEPTQ